MPIDKRVWSEEICKRLTKKNANEIIKLGHRAEEAAKSENQIVDEIPPALFNFYQRVSAGRGVSERIFGLYAVFALGITVGRKMRKMEQILEEGEDEANGGGKNTGGSGGMKN